MKMNRKTLILVFSIARYMLLAALVVVIVIMLARKNISSSPFEEVRLSVESAESDGNRQKAELRYLKNIMGLTQKIMKM